MQPGSIGCREMIRQSRDYREQWFRKKDEILVGWVQQRETQRCQMLITLGYTLFHPTYGISKFFRQAIYGCIDYPGFNPSPQTATALWTGLPIVVWVGRDLLGVK
jgi:hypothetical protein